MFISALLGLGRYDSFLHTTWRIGGHNRISVVRFLNADTSRSLVYMSGHDTVGGGDFNNIAARCLRSGDIPRHQKEDD